MTMNKLKLLAAAAMLLAGAAHADGTLLTMDNQAGGLMYLTDVESSCPVGQHAMYSRASSGTTITGCWQLNMTDKMIFVRWDRTGEVSTYPAGAFRPTDYFNQRFPLQQ